MAEAGETKGKDTEVTVVRNATDLQRLKLQKLMSNPEKLAFIPDRPKDKKFSEPAEFVRNVMGSSAGAGSGEFHVYRHIRRREYSRQEFLQEYKEKEELDRLYHEKIKENRLEVEKKAAKKRNKRQRQKEKQKAKRQKLKEMKKNGIPIDNKSSSSESSEEEEEEERNDGECVKEIKSQSENDEKEVSEETDKRRCDERKEAEAGDNCSQNKMSECDSSKTESVRKAQYRGRTEV